MGTATSDLSSLSDEWVPVAADPISAGTGLGVIKIVVLPYLVNLRCV